MSDTIRVQVDYPFWVGYRGNLAMIRFLPLSLVAIVLAPGFVLYLLAVVLVILVMRVQRKRESDGRTDRNDQQD